MAEPETTTSESAATVARVTPAAVAQATPAAVARATPAAVARVTPATVAQVTPAAVAQATPATVAQVTPAAVAQATPAAVAQTTRTRDRERSAPLVLPARVDEEALREAVWSRVQLARNVKRPHTLELMELMASDVVELHGDRLFRDDPAIAGGFARIDGRDVVFVGHQKGSETDENVRRNFGMPHPEGYRKAMRLFRLAERLRYPVLTIIDTPGAFPGPASEERGVAEAIAQSITCLASLRTPVVVAITGEGGSGGALALAVGDVVLGLENAVYSVISPEGCASILWRTPDAAQDAAVAMRLTAGEQVALGVIDEVVPEPAGGAHTDPTETARRLRSAVVAHLDALAARDADELLAARYARFREMGAYVTAERPESARAEAPGLAERIRDLIELGRRTIAGREPGWLRPQAADEDEEEL